MPAHLLVADDSNVIRKVTRRICEDLSLKVSEAEDGQSALQLCRQDMPDAIFVDAHMPGMDSLDFVRALRELDGGKAPKVVYCLTEYSVSNVARAKRAGADDHLLKPFDRDVLEAKLQEIGVL
jgi:two-component system chemotaxis response regulator CheY